MGVAIERARKRRPSNTGYDRLELFSSRRDRKARTSPLDGRATPGKSGYGVDKLNTPPPYHENTTMAMNVANEVLQPPRTSHAVAAVPVSLPILVFHIPVSPLTSMIFRTLRLMHLLQVRGTIPPPNPWTRLSVPNSPERGRVLCLHLPRKVVSRLS